MTATVQPAADNAAPPAPTVAPAAPGFWLNGVFHTDCPYCFEPMGSAWCCGLSTDDAYAAAVIASAPADVYVPLPAGA